MQTFDVSGIRAVIGTNAWGGRWYSRLLRGSSVPEATLREAAETAVQLGLPVFDTVQNYGLGRCQPMVGRLCGAEALFSAKFTPLSGRYRAGQVRRSLQRDLRELRREAIDIYWLHLPNALRESLAEMACLYREGLIRHIGVSNFSPEECREAKRVLDADMFRFAVRKAKK